MGDGLTLAEVLAGPLPALVRSADGSLCLARDSQGYDGRLRALDAPYWDDVVDETAGPFTIVAAPVEATDG